MLANFLYFFVETGCGGLTVLPVLVANPGLSASCAWPPKVAGLQCEPPRPALCATVREAVSPEASAVGLPGRGAPGWAPGCVMMT